MFFFSHRRHTLIHTHTGCFSFSQFWAFFSCHLHLHTYECIFCCVHALWHAFTLLYNAFCAVFWLNSQTVYWYGTCIDSPQACSWVSGHASRRGLCCLRFPLENRRSMSLCKYTTAVHTSSLTLRYIMAMERCVFV